MFVDELDRCRPAFAVALLERIKHFFEVPNLVFVLVMNRKQLEGAIQGVYGAQTNASDYLGKFLHLALRLPKERTSETHSESQAARFARSTLFAMTSRAMPDIWPATSLHAFKFSICRCMKWSESARCVFSANCRGTGSSSL
ncbi:KAP family P-loop NTPase fold protein [Cupriavidus plantarum]|uniref:KAP family P-loop NTPase fold protein n=1 Tax=Cupriavidus plantarum TaxID=942865 RepID=UPI00339D5FDF